VCFHDAAREREPESRPLPRRLGGQEGPEDPGANVLGDPDAVVADLEGHRGAARVDAGVEQDPARPGDAAQGVDGVGDEAHRDLVEPVRVSPHLGQRLVELPPDLDVVHLEHVAEKLDRLAQNLVDLDWGGLRRAAAPEGEELPHDAGAARGGLGEVVDAARERAGLERAREEVRLPEHDGEWVRELVDDAGQELAHSREPLGLVERIPPAGELLLDATPRRHVTGRDRGPRPAARGACSSPPPRRRATIHPGAGAGT